MNPLPDVPLVIVNYNTLPYLRRCLESILAHSHLEESLPYRLLVVDNASTDGSVEYLEGLGDAIELHGLEKNLGWVQGLNIGLVAAFAHDPEYIIFANSDIVIPGDRIWLERYVGPLMMNEDVGAVGPTSNFVMGLQKFQFNKQLPPVHDTNFLIGFFMAVKAKVLREVGLLDERFGMGGNDDLDLCIRIRKAGYRLLINRKAFIFHYGSKTLLPFFKGWDGIAAQDARTRSVLVEKWGQDTVNELFLVPEGVQGRLGGAGEGI